MGTNDGRASLSGSLSTTINGDPAEHVDYNKCINLPKINGVLVKGDLTQEDLDIKGGYDAQLDPEDPEHLILST